MDKVLIVDGNPKFLSYLCNGLKKYESQFIVSSALHGKEATQALKKSQFSVLVTDLVTANMDGSELLRYMAGLETRSIPEEVKRLGESHPFWASPVEDKRNKVLVVDDSAVSRKVASLALERNG